MLDFGNFRFWVWCLRKGWEIGRFGSESIRGLVFIFFFLIVEVLLIFKNSSLVVRRENSGFVFVLL